MMQGIFPNSGMLSSLGSGLCLRPEALGGWWRDVIHAFVCRLLSKWSDMRASGTHSGAFVLKYQSIAGSSGPYLQWARHGGRSRGCS